jgi:hypothetical protein
MIDIGSGYEPPQSQATPTAVEVMGRHELLDRYGDPLFGPDRLDLFMLVLAVRGYGDHPLIDTSCPW